MNITIQEIKDLFAEYNKKVFDDSLPTPHFEIMTTRSLHGQFRWQKINSSDIAYTIRISNYYDRPLSYFIDTIVHEMLHYYIRYNNIKDTSSHGRIWKKYAKEISEKYGLNITRTSAAGGGISERTKEKKNLSKVKHEYVIVCSLDSVNKYGASVIPVNKIDFYKKRFDRWKLIKDYKIVLAPWNETFDLRHLRGGVAVRHIGKDQFDRFMSYKAVA